MPATPLFLTDFHPILPKYSFTQDDGLKWIREAHALSGGNSRELQESLERVMQKVCCKATHVGARRFAVPDFTHTEWEKMDVYPVDRHPTGYNLGKRSEIFRDVVDQLFEDFYPCADSNPPSDLIHVTCTGYNCPSGAQRRIAKLGWLTKTCVTHAYHMGCMGAIKAIRIGCGFSMQSLATTDIVHTEMCSLHINPTLNTAEQLVGESLFADGFIKYSLTPTPKTPSLKIIASSDEMIPNTEELMKWECKEWGFQMTLSKEIPFFIARNIKGFVDRLLAKDPSPSNEKLPLFAIHPGGPKIIDQIAKIMEVQEEQIAATKAVFFERGNMSSATLPHIWESMLKDSTIDTGRKIISLAFGPGLTISGLLLEMYR